MTDDDADGSYDERPSKTARKRQSDDLQALGEALIELSESELDALPLPEQLRDAVTAGPSDHRPWRPVPAEAVHRQADAQDRRGPDPRGAGSQTRPESASRPPVFTASSNGAIGCSAKAPRRVAALAAEFPHIDSKAVGKLTERARKEQQQSSQKVTPAGRELFRVLRDALSNTAP